MLKKICSFIFCTSFFLSLSFSQEKNASLEVFSFGKETSNPLVLCFVEKDNPSESLLIKKLKTFITEFSKSDIANNLRFKLIIAISHNDYTDLPSDVEVQTFVGLRQLLEQITKYKTPSVFIFTKSDKYNISYKTAKQNCPLWMLKLLFESTQQTNFIFDSKALSFDNDINNLKTLDIFFTENIPAMLIDSSSQVDIEKILINLINNFLKHFSEEWEKNYFLLFIFGNLKIFSERTSIIFISVFIFIIFLFLFFKSIFSTSTLTLNEVFANIFLYLAFVFSNFFLILLARISTNYIFKIILGTDKILGSFSIFYLIIFILICLIEILVFQFFVIIIIKKAKFNFLFFKKYYTNMCLINFFCLVIFDFSIYPFTFMTYVMSNFYHLAKNYFQKILVLVLTFIPTIFYFFLVLGNVNTIINIIKNTSLFLSILTLPIIFILSLIFFIQKRYLRRKFLISLISLILVTAGTIFYFGSMSKKNKIPVEIRQVFTDTKNYTTAKTPYKINKSLELTNIPVKTKTSEEYIKVESDLVNYLNRSVGFINVTSPVNLEVVAVQVFIRNDKGIAIYEANKNFEIGEQIKFLSPQNPSLPFKIDFSSEKNAELNITVKLFSRNNIFNTHLKRSDKNGLSNYAQNFLLEAEHKFKLVAK